jgi:hypothetical protein
MPAQTFRQRHAVRPASDEEYLLSMLQEHEVDVYDPRAVSRHMQHRERREYAKTRTAVRRQTFWRLVVVKSLLVMLPLLMVAACFAFRSVEWLWFGVPSAVGLMLYCLGVSDATETRIADVKVTWEDTPIDSGSTLEGVPIRVRELLEHLQGASSKIGFHISTLRVRIPDKPSLFPDPILVVSYGKAQFPVAVWDEPGFYSPLLG